MEVPAFTVDMAYRLEDYLSAQDAFMTGTQALVRLPIEQARLDRAAGHDTAGFITGYRGSPLAAYDTALTAAKRHLEAEGVTFMPAVNEDLAATALFGTQEVASDPLRTKEGVFGIWYGKGPGVDRAGDALKHGNGFGASRLGGVLALLGDDHGCVSSSMPHQSDQALASFMMPVLHPASIADYIPSGLFGIAASRFSGAWIGMKTISEVLESGATVKVPFAGAFRPPTDFVFPEGGLNYDSTRNFGAPLEMRMLKRLDAFRAFAEANPLDKHAFGAERPRKAVIAVGKAFFDVLAALEILGIGEDDARALGIGLYKVAIAWPIEPTGYRTYLCDAEYVLVVEEKRSFVEAQLRDLLFDMRGAMVLFGKRGREGKALLPEAGELRPPLVAEAIAHAFDVTPSTRGATFPPTSAPANFEVARRTPFFCSGCPHNRSTKVPDGAHAYPGIGCHFMASWMQRQTTGLVQMGGEGVNWIGRSAYTRRVHMFQNLGDGTYFHSGLIAIRAAVAAKVNITYKILYNDAVAMTGGQPIDGSLLVEDIVAQLRGEGIGRIAVVSESPDRFRRPFDRMRGVSLHARTELEAVQDELQTVPGVTVIVYDQACAAEKRRKRKQKKLEEPKRRVFINHAVCEGCGDCSRTSNCISVTPRNTEWGVKRQIDQSSCNKDFSCAEGFCPSFISVSGSEKPVTGDNARRKAILAHAINMAAPALPEVGEIVVAGVGGTGIVTVGAVLAMAAHLEGKGATVLDFMGFAQKGGAVVSHLKVSSLRDQARPVRIGTASATAMIACDLVVATTLDTLQTLATGRTDVVCNLDTVPTGEFVTRGVANMDEGRRVRLLEERGRSVTSLRASRIAIDLFGDSVYSNMLLTGAAWQTGLLPISRDAIERAITLNGRSVDQNMEAFQIGRILADKPHLMLEAVMETEAAELDLNDFIERRAAFLETYQNAAYARCFLDFVAGVRRAEASLGDTALTRAVVANLSRLMAFKDEYEVARLLVQDGALQSATCRFETGAKVRFHLAPPVLSFLKAASGAPCKIAIPAFIGVKLFKLLCFMRPLRGTFADPFGFSHERRESYRLIDDYKALVISLLPHLSPSTTKDIVKIANLIDDVRGYGHVRRNAIHRYKTSLEEQLKKLA